MVYAGSVRERRGRMIMIMENNGLLRPVGHSGPHYSANRKVRNSPGHLLHIKSTAAKLTKLWVSYCIELERILLLSDAMRYGGKLIKLDVSFV
jgi:hypothetical protein